MDSDDAGILTRFRAEVDGLFKPITSKTLEAAIPAQLRATPTGQGETAWFGLSTRARFVVYDKIKLAKADVDSYEKLAEPKLNEPWIDSKTLLGEQGVVLIRHEVLTYRLQATRFGKLLLTK